MIAQREDKTMIEDTRVPVSITKRGKVTIRVYDQAAYETNIAQYYSSEVPGFSKPVTRLPRGKCEYVKVKGHSRYNWTGKPLIKVKGKHA